MYLINQYKFLFFLFMVIFLFINIVFVAAEDTPVNYTFSEKKNNSIYEPKITVDGKIQDEIEWDSSSHITRFGTIITNPMTFLPEKYNITINGWANTTDVFLLTKVDGDSNFEGGFFIRYNLKDSNNKIIDSLLLNNKIKPNIGKESFKDQFADEQKKKYLDDIHDNGFIDGFAKISFSNGTEIFELSHPLCSKDHLHDICINSDDEIGFEFDIRSIYSNKIDNPLIPDKRCGISLSIGNLMKGGKVYELCEQSVFPFYFSYFIFSSRNIRK